LFQPLCLPATASHLVTGNGFGFAVVSPENAIVSKFSTDAEDKKRPMDGWIHLEEFCIV
jgi:hypothetical protein